jgi:hypothetical protein
VVPALIISCCYIVIVHTIWSKGRTLTPTCRSQRNRGETETTSNLPAVAFKYFILSVSVFMFCIVLGVREKLA